MTKIITWTNVDGLIRDILIRRNMLPGAAADAIVAYDTIKWLDMQLTSESTAARRLGEQLLAVEQTAQREAQLLVKLQAELTGSKKGKLKKRVAALEEKVATIYGRLGDAS